MDQHDRDLKDQASNDEALLRVARQRFQQAADAESEYRRLAVEDAEFCAGSQWPVEVKQAREMDKRPCLTINRLPQFVRQVCNDQRQNRPRMRVSPVDSGGDLDTAKVIQGMLRHIELQSDADVAYDTAFEHAATIGKGYFRVLTQYVDEFSFEQELRIERIRNPLTVYFDPAMQRVDGGDANWAFVVQTVNRDVFTAMYPDTTDAELDGWCSLGDGWVTPDTVRVAEYFYMDREAMELAQLADGRVVPAAEVPAGAQVLQTRRTLIPVVQWCKINGGQVLERTRWLGRWIPIIPVLGDEHDLNGKVDYSGLVRNAKDSQRMYNYWVSAETETIALAPRAPFIGAAGQFEGHREWKTANVRNHAYLEYEPVAVGGTIVPPPARNVFEPPVQAITNARLLSADDLKATTGIYDAALGQRSNETSGKAIAARQRESETANFHYLDNLTRAIRHLGRILVDLIPKIYDQQRVIRIVSDDGDMNTVTINGPTRVKGVDTLYDVTVGKYDVVVDVGPSYASKRVEAVDAMTQLTQAYPQLMQVAGDLMVKNMDWPGAQEIAERMKKLLPPEFQEAPEGEDGQMAAMQAMVPQLQHQLEALNAYAQQCEQQAQQLTTENAQLKQQHAVKAEELALKTRDLEVKAALEARKLQLEEQRLLLEAQEQQQTADASTAAQQACQAAEATAALVPETLEQLQTQMTAMQAQLLASLDLLMQAQAARQAPKALSVQRQADGSLVGVVADATGAQTQLTMQRTDDGYRGTVEGGHHGLDG